MPVSIAAVDAIELELPGAHVRFTGRAGGVSSDQFASLNLGPATGDRPEHVRENLQRAADGLPVAAMRQVHGADVRTVTGPTGASEEADGLVTTEPGLALVVTTADCLPVGLAAGGAIAMLHAGWRGLAAGILEAGVQRLRALAGSAPVHAAVGPGAGVCCYEVGDDVAANFPGQVRGGRLDLKAAASERLRAAGVVTVLDVDRCTMCEPDVFFSHRRSGPTTGRQGGLIWHASSKD